jgi:hypothetical protein
MGSLNYRLFFGIAAGGSVFGDGSYSGNIIQGGSALTPVSGVITITGAATIAPDANGTAFAMCDTLVLDGAGASLTSSTACKGLFVIAKTKIEWKNGAGASMTAAGVSGQVMSNPTLYSLIPATYQGKFKQSSWESISLQKDGAAGTANQTTINVQGATGNAGGAWQSGSGGAGAVANSGTAGGGAIGTCFSGGSGGGGNVNSTAGWSAGVAYGGAGGTSGYSNSRGGAGNPGGSAPGGAGATGTGGLAIFASTTIIVASGSVVQADGVQNPSAVHTNGGSSGGGIVGMIHGGSYTNSGTVRANGGAAGTSGSGAPYYGGPGGAGSVNVTVLS